MLFTVVVAAEAGREKAPFYDCILEIATPCDTWNAYRSRR